MSGSQNPFANAIRRHGKAPEKSNFVHTCNRLSQYVKERGSLRNLNLAGIAAKSDAIAKPEESKATTATLNLLNNIENSFQPSSQQGKSVDPFFRSAPLTPTSSASEHATVEAGSSMEAAAAVHKRPQMTIFYEGKVMVFDDFPAEKAKEILLLAGGGASDCVNVCGTWKTPDYNAEKLCSDDAVASCSKEQTTVLPPPAAKESLKQPQAESNSSDLPIARRSSLHRFLAKRKDRAVARAPYQLHNNHNNDRPESSSKNDQEQLELKL